MTENTMAGHTMAEHEHEPVVAFDHNSQAHSADPVSSYRALRS